LCITAQARFLQLLVELAAQAEPLLAPGTAGQVVQSVRQNGWFIRTAHLQSGQVLLERQPFLAITCQTLTALHLLARLALAHQVRLGSAAQAVVGLARGKVEAAPQAFLWAMVATLEPGVLAALVAQALQLMLVIHSHQLSTPLWQAMVATQVLTAAAAAAEVVP
jgi:hypothetical protein